MPDQDFSHIRQVTMVVDGISGVPAVLIDHTRNLV